MVIDAGTYCVKPGCSSDDDCPSDSACMIHEEHGHCVRSCDVNLCIRTCILYHERPEECSDECPSFAECNVHRSAASPAFCVSASDSFDGQEKKICIPVD